MTIFWATGCSSPSGASVRGSVENDGPSGQVSRQELTGCPAVTVGALAFLLEQEALGFSLIVLVTVDHLLAADRARPAPRRCRCSAS